MAQLELQHIAPYLLYGLKVNYKGNILVMEGIYTHKDIFTYENADIPLSEIKPILRPRSDLTKEIEINGERFVPIERLFEIQYSSLSSKGRAFYYEQGKDWVLCSGNWTAVSFKINLSNIEHNYYWVIQNLLEWHFDVFGLIPQGLAIDIN